jgi:hypothetical protein
MGKYKTGILGAFTGKVGNIVGSSWKGTPIIRSAPVRRRWRRSSPAQKEQQAKFKTLTNFLRPLNALFNVSFASFSLKMAGFNKAMSVNTGAITGIYPKFSIDYAKVILGKGNLHNVDSAKAVSIVPGHIIFAWSDNSNIGTALSSDIIIVAAYCPAMDRWVFMDNAAARRDRCVAMDVSVFRGKTAHAYIMIYSDSGIRGSDSLYMGALEIL